MRSKADETLVIDELVSLSRMITIAISNTTTVRLMLCCRLRKVLICKNLVYKRMHPSTKIYQWRIGDYQ